MRLKQLKRCQSAWYVVVFLVLSLLVCSNPGFARKDSLGKKIKEKAKKMKLDKSNVVRGRKNGKSVKFTAAILDHVKSEKELEEGQVIGLLENELEGDETKLPPGKHHIYVKKEGGKWKAYAECDGKIVAEAVRVKMEKKHKDEMKESDKKSRFETEGWCLSITNLGQALLLILGWWILFFICW